MGSCSSVSTAQSPSSAEAVRHEHVMQSSERAEVSNRRQCAKAVDARVAPPRAAAKRAAAPAPSARLDTRATLRQLLGSLKLPPPQLGGGVCGTKEVAVGGRKMPATNFRVPDYMGFVRKLGSGAYGNVAAFSDERSGSKVAVKKVTNAFSDLQDGKRILREVKLLRQFDHDNIIRILDMCPPESPAMDDIYIVTDLMETDLSRVIRSQQTLLESHHQAFTYQILLAMRYLHARGVIHRDLKPANILVNSDCNVKICDFGLARVPTPAATSASPMTEYVVTRWYRAPEVVLLEAQYTEAIDMWSVGCILSELITRRPLFEGTDPTDQIKKIIGTIGYPSVEERKFLPKNGVARRFLEQMCPKSEKANWANLLPSASPAAREAVMALLRFDPSARATAHAALQLPFFEGMEDEPISPSAPEIAKPEKVLDWSFDNFEPTKALLQGFIYCECAGFHPEIVQRDWAKLRDLGFVDGEPIEDFPTGFTMATDVCELN